ncbi:MAG: acylneuraminate cytidylyltransferase family protein [Phycisphaerae bacterium]
MRENQESRSKNQEVLGVVMARGGSVGLPGKALRSLLGRPVLAYTLDHVRESRRITRSVVSSDSAEILGVAKSAGFEVIERPGELASSSSATDPVLRHAVRVLYGEATKSTTEDTENTETTDGGAIGDLKFEISKKEGAGRWPWAVVMLYGNVPVRAGGMIDRCIEMLEETGADSVQTVASVGKMHPYWMFDRDGEGRIRKHVRNDVFRRQDLPELYSPTGAVYVVRTEGLMRAEGSSDPHAFLGGDRRGLVVGAEESVDIDTERDLFLAEAVLRMRKGETVK